MVCRHGLPNALAVCGIVLQSAASAFAAEPAGSDAPPGMAVTVVKATTQRFIDTVRVAGTVVPHEEKVVVPDTNGLRVKKISVENGDWVKVDDELVRLAQPGQSNEIILKAPADGVIYRSSAEVGAIASAGVQLTPPCAGAQAGRGAGGPMGAPSARPEPLFRIAVRGRLDLLAQVPETRIAKLQVGQIAHVAVAGLRDLPGKVRTITSEIDRDTQAGWACIELTREDPENSVRVGAFGHATVEVDARMGTSIPLSAVLSRVDPATRAVSPVIQVVVQDKQGSKIETRPVSLGLISGGKAEIREGLREGDLVVERAGSFLREGDRVKPVLADRAPTD